jgi:hypothetical protein
VAFATSAQVTNTQGHQHTEVHTVHRCHQTVAAMFGSVRRLVQLPRGETGAKATRVQVQRIRRTDLGQLRGVLFPNLMTSERRDWQWILFASRALNPCPRSGAVGTDVRRPITASVGECAGWVRRAG